MKKVVLSQKARSYLLSESRYLRERNPAAAMRFVERLREARHSLARFETIGFERDAPPVPGVRRFLVGDYVLDYFVGAFIEIVAIRHGRQAEPESPRDDDFDYEA